MLINWILRIRSAHAHSPAVIAVMGPPDVELPYGDEGEELMHIYEAPQEVEDMSALIGTLLIPLEKARQLRPEPACAIDVHVRFSDGEDYFAILPPPLLRVLGELGASLELHATL